MCAWGLNEWGDIANIVIAVASVATAIVTAVVLFKQRNDNIKEKQPRYTFSEQDGELLIRGEQDKCLQIESVEVREYIDVWSLNRKRMIKKIVPIESQILVCIKESAEGQIISIPASKIRSTQIADRFSSEETCKRIDRDSYNYRVFNLICIEYIDIHLQHRRQYFVNRIIISEQEYKQYIKLARKVSKVPLAVSDINLKSLLEIK